jgi:hypothetical protein
MTQPPLDAMQTLAPVPTPEYFQRLFEERPQDAMALVQHIFDCLNGDFAEQGRRPPLSFVVSLFLEGRSQEEIREAIELLFNRLH